MNPELKAAIDQLNKEWSEMKDFMTKSFPAEEKKRFGEYLGDTSAQLTKMSAAITELELKAARPGAGQSDAVKVKHPGKTKAFGTYIRKGIEGGQMTPDDVKFMIVSDDTLGGFGATDEFDANIIKGIIQISPVRSLARVRNTNSRAIKVMKRTGTFAAQWVAERGTRSETTGLTYGLEEIPTHEIYALVDISVQDLEDNSFDLEGELALEFAQQFAYAEGQAFVNGTGLGKPEGFMVNAAIATDFTGDATKLTYAGFVSVSHNIKIGYQQGAQFVLNLQSIGVARQMTSGTGELLWAPMAVGAPATILGYPYTLVPDMDAEGSAKYPVAFGVFNAGYQWVDRVNVKITRDELTQATSGAVRFIARKRVGGQVVLAEAIRKLQCHV